MVESKEESEIVACCYQVGMGDVRKDEAYPVFDGSIVRHCDVCYLLDGDTRPKETRYCKLCDAFMCASCQRSPWRRGLAAFSRRIKQRLADGVKQIKKEAGI